MRASAEAASLLRCLACLFLARRIKVERDSGLATVRPESECGIVCTAATVADGAAAGRLRHLFSPGAASSRCHLNQTILRVTPLATQAELPSSGAITTRRAESGTVIETIFDHAAACGQMRQCGDRNRRKPLQ